MICMNDISSSLVDNHARIGSRVGGGTAPVAGLAFAVFLVGAAAGCGGATTSHPPLSTAASPTTTGSSSHAKSPSTTATVAEPSPHSESFNFNSTADCLDQFSGDGATRATADGAETASVAVPKDGNWDTFDSVEVYFFPSAARAARYARNGGLERTETLVRGNVVISGSAVATPYSRKTDP